MAGNPPVPARPASTASRWGYGAGVEPERVIPATNRPDTLERCLDAIRRATDPPEEVIVVDEPAGVGPASARTPGSDEGQRLNSGVRGLRRPGTPGRLHAHTRRVRTRSGRLRRLRLLRRRALRPRRRLDLPEPAAPLVHQGAGSGHDLLGGARAVRRDASSRLTASTTGAFACPPSRTSSWACGCAAGGQIRLDRDPGHASEALAARQMMVTDLIHRGTPWTAMMLDHGPQGRASRMSAAPTCSPRPRSRPGSSPVGSAGAGSRLP